MAAFKYLFSLAEMQNKPSLVQYAGGKARGLAEADIFAAELRKSGFNISVPQTFILSWQAHIDYKEKGHVSDDVLNEAMTALHACGDTAAVRSSADIEDMSGQSQSGIFETVLNIRSQAQMKHALETVYNSAYRRTAQMSVIIQRMITKPEKAGVIYSEDFAGDPFAVIHFVTGKPANGLLSHKESGNVVKLSKHLEIKTAQKRELVLLLPDNLHDLPIDSCFYTDGGYLSLKQTEDDFGKEIPQLIATANLLEQQLGYPLDMEFALQNGHLYLLQQRPYICNSDFALKSFRNGDISGYKKTTPTIRGTVITAGDKYIGQQLEKNAQILDLSDHIILLSDFEAQRNNFFATAVFQAAAYDRIKAKLIIDNNSGVLYNALYSHIGNRLREAGQPFFISRSNQFLAEIKNGDAIEINLQTGKYRRIFVK